MNEALIFLLVAASILVLILWAARGYGSGRVQTHEDVSDHASAVQRELRNLRLKKQRDSFADDATAVQLPVAARAMTAHPHDGRVIVLDTETTGLSQYARLITLAAIRFEVRGGEPTMLEHIHRVYDPRRNNEPGAERIHGWDDWTLRFQPLFADEAAEIHRWLSWADRLVMHNAEFDTRFLNRELRKAEVPELSTSAFCTMEGFRARYPGQRASLDECAARIGLRRYSHRHGALEDAFLASRLYFSLLGSQRPPQWTGAWMRPTNFQQPQPRPAGDLPRRQKKVPRK